MDTLSKDLRVLGENERGNEDSRENDEMYL